MKVLLVALVFCFVSSQAWACYISEEQSSHVDELIQRTDNIILAVVDKAELIDITGEEDYRFKYNFKPVETLKGFVKSDFTLEGLLDYSLKKTNNFNHHSDKEFWDETGYKYMDGINCNIYPGFDVGTMYLVFLDKPYHFKSFEMMYKIKSQIGIPKDKWLEYVREKVKEQASELSNE